jgi:hypothetical protein
LTGKHFQHEYPKLNGDYFQQFLHWLSAQLRSDYAILQIDQAPAHANSAIIGTPSFSRTQSHPGALAVYQEISQKRTFPFLTRFT